MDKKSEVGKSSVLVYFNNDIKSWAISDRRLLALYQRSLQTDPRDKWPPKDLPPLHLPIRPKAKDAADGTINQSPY